MGFYSAEDADSADPDNPEVHGEGSFYIWRKNEIDQLLGATSDTICRYFGVLSGGNVENDPHGEFTGRNILYRALNRNTRESSEGVPKDLAESIRLLFAAREKRPRPHLDNKVLTAWNGLMISALAKAAGVLQEPQYLASATRAAEFLLAHMYDRDNGTLLRRFCDGEAGVPGFADDYAFLAQGLLDLFEASGNPEYFRISVNLLERGMNPFEDEADGGFFSTASGAPDILMRLKDDYDGAEPSANSVAADVLLRLGHLTGNQGFLERAERTLLWFAPKLRTQPTMAPQMAAALSRWLETPEQVIVRCKDLDRVTEEFLTEQRRRFAPFASIVALTDDAAASLAGLAPFLANLERQGSVTVYECRNLVCELPRQIA